MEEWILILILLCISQSRDVIQLYFSNRIVYMKKIIAIFIIIILAGESNSFAQQIIRSSLSSFGNMTLENGIVYRQTVGQPSSTSVFVNDKTSLLQGFQQPVSPIFNAPKEKVCTIYLSPNPALDIVLIKFAEEIGVNQISIIDMLGKVNFKANSAEPSYIIDVSKFLKGIYLVNIISKSGYHCNQKLIVI